MCTMKPERILDRFEAQIKRIGEGEQSVQIIFDDDVKNVSIHPTNNSNSNYNQNVIIFCAASHSEFMATA